MSYTGLVRSALRTAGAGHSTAPPSLLLTRAHWWRLLTLCRAVCQTFKYGYFTGGMVLSVGGALGFSGGAAASVLILLFLIMQCINLALPARKVPRFWQQVTYGLRNLLIHFAMHCSKARWRWWVFWQLYLQFGDLDNVCKNYAEMWLEYYEVHSFDTANNVNGENGHEPDSNNGDTGPPLSLVIFLDNSLPLEVPCPHNMDDRAFLQHIARFYYLQKMRKGLLEVMGFKTLGVVEVVEMQGDHNNRVVGRSDTFLGLGRYDGNRIIYFLRKPEAIGRGSRIVRFLREKGVLTEAKRTEHRHNNSWANSRVNSEVNSGANSPVNYDHGCSYTPRPPQPVNFLDNVYNLPFYQLHNALNDSLQDPPDMHTDVDDKVWALNFVSTWHTNFAALAVVAPVIASMIVSIAWPAIAVLKYGEDMQTSVQTGFTVGSYVVTAGAVLIALVTFAASVYDSNTKYTKDLQSQTVRV